MTRSKKTQKINHNNVVYSSFIENLDDYLLTQILFRLPSCASVLACKPVNKRWCSLISDPRFAALFSDHKTRNTALLKSCPTTDNEEPPRTYLISVNKHNPPFEPIFNCMGNASSTNEAVFGSPNFNLEYLPCRFNLEATFRDLVLCSDVETCLEGRGQIYYITNPLTKQWVALPPSPVVFEIKWGLKPLAAFLYRQPHDYTQDYQFRVVLINRQSPQPVYELLVYCSEIGEWKKINLHVQIKPELAAQKSLYNSNFEVVVCDGVIFLYHKLGFAAFNPFDVDETTNDTTLIEAKVLPSLHANGFLLESSGNLYFIYTPKIETGVWYKKNGSAIEMALKVWKLNPNQVPLKWEATFDGTCSGNLNRVVQASRSKDINFSGKVLQVGMHPRDDNLIYMHLRLEKQFVLCDTRSRLIMPSKSLPHCDVDTTDRLEIQWWPTSIPKARSSATLFSK